MKKTSTRGNFALELGSAATIITEVISQVVTTREDKVGLPIKKSLITKLLVNKVVAKVGARND